MTKSTKLFRVIDPPNSSFFGKVGRVTHETVYYIGGNQGYICYRLDFSKNGRPTVSQRAQFFSYQLEPVEQNNNIVNPGSQERML